MDEQAAAKALPAQRARPEDGILEEGDGAQVSCKAQVRLGAVGRTGSPLAKLADRQTWLGVE